MVTPKPADVADSSSHVNGVLISIAAYEPKRETAADEGSYQSGVSFLPARAVSAARKKHAYH